jgi:hypothetical protein
MTPRPLPTDDADANAMESALRLRRTQREADAGARRLAERLADVDLHQREARFMLERAGLLTRRKRRA